MYIYIYMYTYIYIYIYILVRKLGGGQGTTELGHCASVFACLAIVTSRAAAPARIAQAPSDPRAIVLCPLLKKVQAPSSGMPGPKYDATVTIPRTAEQHVRTYHDACHIM